MFTKCDIIKNWAQRYFHKVTSSKVGARLYAMALQRHAIQCQFYNFVEFIAKIEVCFLYVGI